MKNDEMFSDDEIFTDDEESEVSDYILSDIYRMIVERESKDCMLNPEKIMRIVKTYLGMKYLLGKYKQIKVTYAICEPLLSMGTVTVVTPKIPIDNPQLFAKLINTADTLDVCPKTDGKVMLEFGFNDVTVPTEYQRED